MGVSGADGSTMNADNAAGDGQAQPGSSRFAVAIIGYAIKRLKDVGQLRFGNAGPMIANDDEGGRGLCGYAHFHRVADPRIANRVADHVFNRAVQQLRIAIARRTVLAT